MVNDAGEVINIENQCGNGGLQFTGNWFIDAGILGFSRMAEGVFT